MGGILAVAAALFFGMGNISVRKGQLQQGLDNFQGLYVSILINNILNVLLLFSLYLSGVRFPRIDTAALFCFAGGGALTSFIGRVLLFSSINRIGPSRGSTLNITAPVFTVILGMTVLGETISTAAIMGIFLVLCGACFLSRDIYRNKSTVVAVQTADRAELPVVSGTHRERVGLVLAIIAGAALGTGNIFRKLGMMHYDNPLVGVSIGAFTALLMTLVYFASNRCLKEVIKVTPLMLKGGYLGVGIFYSGALYATFSALSYLPVTLVNSIRASEPLITTIGSRIILRTSEKLTLRFIIAMLVILLGVVVVVLLG